MINTNCRLPEGMRVNEKCLETGCENCGWNDSVAKKRKDYMKTLGLTKDEKDGLSRLVIMPRRKYIKLIHVYVNELIDKLDIVLYEAYHDVDEEVESDFSDLKQTVNELQALTKAIASRNLPLIIKLASENIQDKEIQEEENNGQPSAINLAEYLQQNFQIDERANDI